jgi:hypothetical protein
MGSTPKADSDRRELVRERREARIEPGGRAATLANGSAQRARHRGPCRRSSAPARSRSTWPLTGS